MTGKNKNTKQISFDEIVINVNESDKSLNFTEYHQRLSHIESQFSIDEKSARKLYKFLGKFYAD